MERIRGDAHLHAGDGEAESTIHLRGGGREQSQHDDRRAERADELWERVGAVRQRLSAGAEHAAESLDRRTGFLSLVRARPLAAVGVAFSFGVAAAVSVTSKNPPHWAVERTRRRLRAAVLSAFTALVVDEVRDLLTDDEGVGAVLRSFMSDDDSLSD